MKSTSNDDHVENHSIQLVSLGLFYLNYRDAIREGDGERVLNAWRYMLPMFIATGRKNYAKEAFLFLINHDVLLPPRMAHQMLWRRFVNVRGVSGGNIPADLHNEHLNRVCKEAITGLGSNKSSENVTRIGKAIGTILPILSHFDQDNDVTMPSGKHSRASSERDRDIVVKDLVKYRVLEYHQGRQLLGLAKAKSLLHKMSRNDLEEWIVSHFERYSST